MVPAPAAAEEAASKQLTGSDGNTNPVPDSRIKAKKDKTNLEKPKAPAAQEKAAKKGLNKLGKNNPNSSGTVQTASVPETDTDPSDVYLSIK